MIVDITAILSDGQMALQLAQSLPVPLDPRVALTLQIAAGTLTILQSLDAQGVFTREGETIEIDDIGVMLLANLRLQLAELASDGAAPPPGGAA